MTALGIKEVVINVTFNYIQIVNCAFQAIVAMFTDSLLALLVVSLACSSQGQVQFIGQVSCSKRKDLLPESLFPSSLKKF